MDNLILGSHVSYKKQTQLMGSVEEAISYGANTFMFYTGAPQNTMRSEINDEITSAAKLKMEQEGIDFNNLIVHAPYIINLANTEKPESYNFAINFLKQEISRCEQIGVNKLVLHPGSSVKLSREEGINNIINGLNVVLNEEQDITILLETMALKGSEIGTIDDIKTIIDNVELSNKLGVCIDTCHISDNGLDLKDFDAYLDEFENKIGLDKIMCVHINDSKNVVGAHKDRHENFGFGHIGFENLMNVIYHDKLKNVPKILETPYVAKDEETKGGVYPPYKFEIEMIKNKIFDKELISKIREYYK